MREAQPSLKKVANIVLTFQMQAADAAEHGFAWLLTPVLMLTHASSAKEWTTRNLRTPSTI